MIFYQLDHVVEEVLRGVPSAEQLLLKKYLNEDFSKKEAQYLWERIVDHKWLIGERLRRDVGYRVAAIDYVENFYEPGAVFGGRRPRTGAMRRLFRPVGATLRSYFVSKSKILPQ